MMDIKELRRLRLQEWFTGRTLPVKDKSYISQIITGKSALGEKAAARLEHEYNLPLGYLTMPSVVVEKPPLPNSEELSLSSKKYPVLTISEDLIGSELTHLCSQDSIQQWLESDEPTLGTAFWFKVDNESMTAPSGLSVPEGSFVLLDTGREAVHGSLVLVGIPSNNGITLKKLIIDSGEKFLKALNPMWPAIIKLDHNAKIIGVAVEAKIKLAVN